MTTQIEAAPSTEMLDLALMVSESAWQAKDYIAARRAALMALELDPNSIQAMTRVGRIALIHRDYVEAAQWFDRILDRQRSPAAAVNLAIAYGGLKLFVPAIHWCDLALQWDAKFRPAFIHKAALLEETGQLDQAEQVVRLALDVFPGDSELLFALAHYQLRRGDFENGWRNYEQRPPRLELARKLDEYPEWQGEDLTDKTILACGEQGLGDQIQFVRYVPLLIELGANVVLFTKPELARLFAGLMQPLEQGTISRLQVITSDVEVSKIEPDYWVAMCSLPLRWRQFEQIDVVGTPKTAAGQTWPYLWADRAALDRFVRLVGNDRRLKVGLCWKGNPQHRRDEYRSASFDDFRPLLDGFRRTSGRMCPNGDHVLDGQGVCCNCPYGEFDGIEFFSLQIGDTESGLVNLTEYCHDMADTAAAIAALDVVITVDTAVLHLAGAIGKPVWGLIYAPGDWRWGASTECETPWYASARLFRQAKQRDWNAESESIAFDLRAIVSDHRGYRRELGSILLTGLFIGSVPNFESHLPCRYGAMTWPQNDHYIGRALDLYGEYSESEAEVLRKLLKPGDNVVEAGANVGGLTLPMADAVGSNGVVYAFEPQPLYLECLRRNTATRVNHVFTHRAALGREGGREISMRSVEERKIHAPGWESTGREFDVLLCDIDSLRLERCALIKIDVDGPEHDILLGAEATIERCRPMIYVEYDKPAEYPEMLAWLHAKGYRLYRHAAPLFNPGNFRGNPVNVFGSMISLMILAVPNERKDVRPGDWGLERVVITEGQ